MGAVVTVYSPGQTNVVLRGTAENASLDGVRLRLPVALAEESHVSVALEGTPSRLGIVRWVRPQGESGVVHGIRFHVLTERRGHHSWALLRFRVRRVARRIFIALIALGGIAIAAFGLVWLIEGLRAYNPKHYEPKDIEREGYDLQRRLEELKRPRQP